MWSQTRFPFVNGLDAAPAGRYCDGCGPVEPGPARRIMLWRSPMRKRRTRSRQAIARVGMRRVMTVRTTESAAAGRDLDASRGRPPEALLTPGPLGRVARVAAPAAALLLLLVVMASAALSAAALASASTAGAAPSKSFSTAATYWDLNGALDSTTSSYFAHMYGAVGTSDRLQAFSSAGGSTATGTSHPCSPSRVTPQTLNGASRPGSTTTSASSPSIRRSAS